MKIRRETVKSACTAQDKSFVAKAAEIMANKWTPEILYALSNGSRRFSELQTESGDPNPRTLSARLDALEHAGIVTKQSFSEVPPRVEYALTPRGHGLVPILEQMHAWGKRYASKY